MTLVQEPLCNSISDTLLNHETFKYRQADTVDGKTFTGAGHSVSKQQLNVLVVLKYQLATHSHTLNDDRRRAAAAVTDSSAADAAALLFEHRAERDHDARTRAPKRVAD